MKVTEATMSYINEFKAIVTGDDADKQAERSFRANKSALLTHISSMEGDLIALEDKVEEATEKLRLARYNNGKPTIDRNAYVNNLVKAKNALEEAKGELANHKETMEFLKSESEAMSREKK